MDDGVLLTMASALKLKRQLEQELLAAVNLRHRLASDGVQHPVYMPPMPVQFVNDSGETAPAYAVMKVTDVDENGRVEIDKPDTAFQRLYLVNGSRDVANEGVGTGTWLTDFGRDNKFKYVLYNTSSGTPAYGESWGPKNGQWSLEKNYWGFNIQGGNTGSGSSARTVAIQHVVNHAFAKLDGALSQGGSATASLLQRNTAGSAWIDSTMKVTAYDYFLNLTETVEADTKVKIEYQHSIWVVANMYCAASDT